MLYRLVTLLSFLLGTVALAEGQEPDGYWLYVDGAWKGGFVSRAECDAAAAKTTGRLSECYALYPRPGGAATPTEKPKQQITIPGSSTTRCNRDRWGNTDCTTTRMPDLVIER